MEIETREPWWTNVLLSCVHLLLFGAYLMLMFDR